MLIDELIFYCLPECHIINFLKGYTTLYVMLTTMYCGGKKTSAGHCYILAVGPYKETEEYMDGNLDH